MTAARKQRLFWILLGSQFAVFAGALVLGLTQPEILQRPAVLWSVIGVMFALLIARTVVRRSTPSDT
jgi:hypothetical protein